MAREILFVTLPDKGFTEGFSYVLDLAKILSKDIHVLVVRKTQKISEYFESIMTAITSAQAGKQDTTRRSARGKDIPEKGNGQVKAIVKELKDAHVSVNVETTQGDVVSAVKDCLKNDTRVDMVILSPDLTGNSVISPSELHRLVRTASRPIVTMARNHA